LLITKHIVQHAVITLWRVLKKLVESLQLYSGCEWDVWCRDREETEMSVSRLRQDRDIGVTVTRREWDISVTSPRWDETFEKTPRDVRSRRSNSDYTTSTV